MNKRILDACCGSKMMWFDKNHPDVLYADIRRGKYEVYGEVIDVNPDVVHDFRFMPYPDASFNLVVLDPPHRKNLSEKSILGAKYGTLFPTWQEDIKAGVNECMRVLKPGGVFIFKWNEVSITVNQVLDVIEHKPLFGHTSGKHGKTKWLAFMKSDTPTTN